MLEAAVLAIKENASDENAANLSIEEIIDSNTIEGSNMLDIIDNILSKDFSDLSIEEQIQILEEANLTLTENIEEISGTTSSDMAKDSYVLFGEYKDKPVLWKVLTSGIGLPATLISDKVLSIKPAWLQLNPSSQYPSVTQYNPSHLQLWLKGTGATCAQWRSGLLNYTVEHNQLNTYYYEKAFRDNFSEKELSSISLVDSAHFWLPSKEEIEMWIGTTNAERKASPTMEAIASNQDTSAPMDPSCRWWTRDAGASRDYLVIVNNTGAYTNGPVLHSSIGVRPCTLIKENIPMTGSGTLEDPYILV